jgi:hypothetical protein
MVGCSTSIYIEIKVDLARWLIWALDEIALIEVYLGKRPNMPHSFETIKPQDCQAFLSAIVVSIATVAH